MQRIILLTLIAVALLLPAATVSRVEAVGATTRAAQSDSEESSKLNFVPGRVLVRFRSGAAATAALDSEEPARLMLRSQGGRAMPVEVEDAPGLHIVRGLRLAHVAPEETLEAVEAFKARPDVLYAEPDFVVRPEATPNDPRFTSGEMHGLNRVAAPQAWDITKGGDDVVVGVVDSGVDTSHEDLRDNIWRNPGETAGNGVDDDGNGFVDDVQGWDFFHNDATVFDNEAGDDHGTHVAGTIGARGDNGVGVAGVAWRVKVMPLKALGPNGGSTSTIVAAYTYARAMRQRGVNLRVLNNSYGGPGYSQAARDAIAALNDAGILFIAAAGNESRDNFAAPHFPSDYDLPNVINVAASDSQNNFDLPVLFSNYGNRVVTMTAPGNFILSTTPGNTYKFFSGTSMATPHVTGAAALVLAAKPGVSLRELRGALVYGGDSIGQFYGATRTGRRLNAFKAVTGALENDVTPPAQAANLRVVSSDTHALAVTWTAPGDDGNSGTPSDYDFVFFNPTTNTRTFVQQSVGPPNPAGSTETATLTLPYSNQSGVLELYTYDNVGNASVTTLSVSYPVTRVNDPYTVSVGPAEPLSTGGDRLPVDGDDKYFFTSVPFTPLFFNMGKSQGVTVSTNGALYFLQSAQNIPPTRANGDADDAVSDLASLTGRAMIAGLWDDIDLSTSRRADAGIYVVRPDANRVIYRWQGVPCNAGPPSGQCTGGAPVNFEMELARDGKITLRYGDGNVAMQPVVGISGGDAEPYLVTSHTSERGRGAALSLTGAQTVVFTPRAAPPELRFDFPLQGSVFAPPAEVNIMASGFDVDGTISKVEFFANGTLIGTQTAPDQLHSPDGRGYFMTWSNVPVGAYAITAVATDNQGLTATAGPVNVRVSSNQIDANEFFVRQQYLDFLNREPDGPGLAFWTNEINNCGLIPNCREVKRINVSAAFFLSIEFQETGYLVYRTHKAAFGNLPGKPVPLRREAMLPDMQQIGQNVVVNQGDWLGQLEANKRAYFDAVVARARFTTTYPQAMTAEQFVDALNTNAGGALSSAERDALVAALKANTKTRAQVLRAVAEDSDFALAEKNRAFVLMQYFGYLRRNPDDAPEPNLNYAGYEFWLGKLNEFGGNYVRAEMVKAFLDSSEYRQRFGQ